MGTAEAAQPTSAAILAQNLKGCNTAVKGIKPSSGNVLHKLETHFLKIDQLDSFVLRTSVTINWEYWRLGVAYTEFCKVLPFTAPLRTMH